MASLADAYKPSRRAGMEHSPRPVNPWPAVDRAAASLASYIPSPTQGRRMSMDEAGNVYGSTAEENQLSSLVDFLAGTGAAPTAMARQTPGMLNAIGVWHGSPHKFDKFDLSKIGTGEGAQAYGHGAYLAESPAVARTYAETGAKNSAFDPGAYAYEIANDIGDYTVYKYNHMPLGGAHHRVGEFLDEEFDTPEVALEYLKSKGHIPENALTEWNDDGLRLTAYSREPNLYKVSLEWPDPAREAADPLGPHHFLDWDDAVGSHPKFQDISAIPELADYGDELQHMGGGAVLNAINRRAGQGVAERVLNNLGVPGIRYLDAGSRGAGDGTRNYVVFQDSLAKILERNGIPIR